MTTSMTNLAIAQATALGCVIIDPTLAPIVFAGARVDDFDPPYREVAEAIHGLRLGRGHIDQLAVVDELTRRGSLGKVGGSAFVFELAGYGIGGRGGAEYAVEVIATNARRRRLWRAGARMTEAATLEDANPLRIAQAVIAEAQGVIDSIDADGDVLTPTLGEFITTEDAPYDWVVPGLLERGDRLVLTGTEGLGKSVMLRQLGVMAAAGVHPFTNQPHTPARVLIVDCENGVPKMRRALRPLAHQARTYGSDPSDSLWVECRPSGLDLTKPEDETWLVRHVAGLQPDLLLTGPIYRLHAGNPNDEEPARQVARVLDRCRAASNCALVVEAHSGHGFGGSERPVRPTGSSLWLRWPEFGYGMRPARGSTPTNRVADFVPWRGDREERDWPRRLKAGGVWPWTDDPSWEVDAA